MGTIPKALQTYVTAMRGNLTKIVCTKRLINAAIVNGNKQYPNTQTLWKKLLPKSTTIKRNTQDREDIHCTAKKFEIECTDSLPQPDHGENAGKDDLTLILTGAKGHEKTEDKAKDERTP